MYEYSSHVNDVNYSREVASFPGSPGLRSGEEPGNEASREVEGT